MEELARLDQLISIGRTIVIIEIFGIIFLSFCCIALFLIWIQLQKDIKGKVIWEK